MILNIDLDMEKIDLSPFYRYIEWNHDQLKFFSMSPGENHCKLLAYLSSQLSSNSKVADLGTYCGGSAIALAFNPNVQVLTYDIDDYLPDDKITCKNLTNIRFIRDNCIRRISDYLDASIVFLDTAPHDGQQESEILGKLMCSRFRGLLICDDIFYSDSMKSWWNSVQLKKYDVTRYGHYSGTGIIVFDQDYIDVEIS